MKKLSQTSLLLFLQIMFSITLSDAQVMCSDELGLFDYVSIPSHNTPFDVYHDVSGGVPVTSVNYFRFTNKTTGCSANSAETTTWLLTELDVLTGTPVVIGNVALSSTTASSTQIQGIPNPANSPYRFKLTLTSNGVSFEQQFIIHVTRNGFAVLGTNQNNQETLRSNSLDVGGNNINSVTYALRTQSGNGWQTTQLLDGIIIDNPNSILDAHTWWKQDPYNNIHSWGDQTNTYLTINQGKMGIGRNPTTNLLEVNGNVSKTTAGGWLANSDKRIKTDIQDIDNSLELIKRLHPVKFKYTMEWMKKNPTVKDQYYYNFIAQEFQQVFPEAVKGSGEFIEGDEKEILQIDTYNAQIVSIKAIQEQQKIIDSQQVEIDKLNKELNSIKNYLNIEAKVTKSKSKK